MERLVWFIRQFGNAGAVRNARVVLDEQAWRMRQVDLLESRLTQPAISSPATAAR